MWNRKKTLTGILASLVFATVGYAQCVGPDNLDIGNCCGSVLPNLPGFPAGSQPGLGICWDNCLPTQQRLLKVVWDTPVQTKCSEYHTKLHVFDAGSGALLLDGAMVMNYTRTWNEAPVAGAAPVQFWRFVVKADLMNLAPTAAIGCPVPNCISPATAFPTAFFYGYADYALNCATGNFMESIVLYHGCDFLMHKPVLSDRPGAFHPNRAYGIVAPHSAIQPFVPGNLPAPGGALLAEATRNLNNPLAPLACKVEDRITSGGIAPLAQGCLCPLAAFPAQVTLSVVGGQTTCVDAAGVPGTFVSQNISFPAIPWPHTVYTSIGTWTNAAAFPGPEHAWVVEGLFRTHNVCEANDYYEVYYGGATRGGWQVLSPTPAGLSQNFTDIADNYTTPATGAAFPILGSIRPTDHLIYLNTP